MHPWFLHGILCQALDWRFICGIISMLPLEAWIEYVKQCIAHTTTIFKISLQQLKRCKLAVWIIARSLELKASYFPACREVLFPPQGCRANVSPPTLRLCVPKQPWVDGKTSGESLLDALCMQSIMSDLADFKAEVMQRSLEQFMRL